MLQFNFKPKQMLPAVLAVVLAAPVAVRAEAPTTQPDQSVRPERPNRERRQPRNQHRDPAAMLDRMHQTINGLDLSEEQKTKVDAIFAQAKSDFEALQQKWKQDDVAPRDRMEQGRKLMRDLNQKVMAVLTDQQKTALKEKRKEMMEKRDRWQGHGRRGEMRGDRQGPPEMMERMHRTLNELNLTDEQKQKIKEVMTDAREKSRKIMEEAREQIDQILTPEQREKLKEIRRPNRQGPGGQAPAGGPDQT